MLRVYRFVDLGFGCVVGVLVSLDKARWVVCFCLLGLGLVGGIGFVSGVVLERWVGCRAAGV